MAVDRIMPIGGPSPPLNQMGKPALINQRPHLKHDLFQTKSCLGIVIEKFKLGLIDWNLT